MTIYCRRPVCDRLSLWIFNVAERWRVMRCVAVGHGCGGKMLHYGDRGHQRVINNRLSMSPSAFGTVRPTTIGRETL